MPQERYKMGRYARTASAGNKKETTPLACVSELTTCLYFARQLIELIPLFKNSKISGRTIQLRLIFQSAFGVILTALVEVHGGGRGVNFKETLMCLLR
jgi:hypothetical protein